jgi:hypothetical protein
MGLRKDFIKKVTGHRRMEWLNINLKGTTKTDLNMATGKRLGLMAHRSPEIISMARKTGRAQGLKKIGQITPGSFFYGKANGKGTLIAADGQKYVGFFKDDLFHGSKVKTWLTGCESTSKV